MKSELPIIVLIALTGSLIFALIAPEKYIIAAMLFLTISLCLWPVAMIIVLKELWR